MPVDAVNTSNPITFLTPKDKSNSTSIDTDTFLKLLVAQFEYQNPLEPQTDTAAVAQLAQMSSLEQLQQMNSSLSNTQAYDMIGKYVYAKNINSTTGVTTAYFGFAESVIIKNGVQYVLVGDTAIPVSEISEVVSPTVVDTSSSSDTETPTGSDTGG